MDKKDEIILQQLEVIRTMTERNLRSMGDDFWGTPFEGVLSPKSPSAPPSGVTICAKYLFFAATQSTG